jgi:hypothetical protein
MPENEKLRREMLVEDLRGNIAEKRDQLPAAMAANERRRSSKEGLCWSAIASGKKESLMVETGLGS